MSAHKLKVKFKSVQIIIQRNNYKIQGSIRAAQFSFFESVFWQLSLTCQVLQQAGLLLNCYSFIEV